jgi:hypothetical protein
MKKNKSMEKLTIKCDIKMNYVGFDVDSFGFIKSSLLKFLDIGDLSFSNEKMEERMSQELEMNQSITELKTSTGDYSFLKTNKTITSLRTHCLVYFFHKDIDDVGYQSLNKFIKDNESLEHISIIALARYYGYQAQKDFLDNLVQNKSIKSIEIGLSL